MTYLGYQKEELDKLGAGITALEINNQPRIWKETYEIIKDRKNEIQTFLNKAFKHEDLRIILTGAGSSAFVGDCTVPYLDKKICNKIEMIESTDIVSHPECYFKKDIPTLLISCARSGNSPESVATANLARDLIDNLYHIVLTCNPDGELAKTCQEREKEFVILMPNDSNDKGFAMTSSFTSMVLSTLLIFNLEKLDDLQEQIDRIILNGENVLQSNIELLKEVSKLDLKRVVYLGANALKGLARESALKILELTSGKVATSFDSCLGFRHGPKSIVDDKTLVIIYLSNDSYARKYEIDFLKEIYTQNGGHKVLAVTSYEDKLVKESCDYYICIEKEKVDYEDDSFLVFDYILNAQIFAIFKSIKLGVNPDNPSPDGSVNRVVKGVTIHEFNGN
ncbi:SIS domain-containing protein [Abyssisolibacter fermentans]|uniref:SIS domain-containing protein n=1 Tax=Abyssisolibacter fermentans TaxID=1766203 RepID=UPI00082CDC58|nr:SIS domain-containing protein [Abyssisolibacter fermentans]